MKPETHQSFKDLNLPQKGYLILNEWSLNDQQAFLSPFYHMSLNLKLQSKNFGG